MTGKRAEGDTGNDQYPSVDLSPAFSSSFVTEETETVTYERHPSYVTTIETKHDITVDIPSVDSDEGDTGNGTRSAFFTINFSLSAFSSACMLEEIEAMAHDRHPIN